jgi:ribosomal protein S9
VGIAITKVTVSKNPVGTSEKFLITVTVKELTSEPTMYRLPYTLGKEKYGLKAARRAPQFSKR